MKYYLLAIMFLLVGCEHRCPKCPKVVYKDRIVVQTIEKPVYIVVSDDVKILAALQIAREGLLMIRAGGNSGRVYYKKYHYQNQDWADRVLMKIDQALKDGD